MFSRSPPRPIENARTAHTVGTADSDRNFNEAILDVLGMAIGGNWGVPESFDKTKVTQKSCRELDRRNTFWFGADYIEQNIL